MATQKLPELFFDARGGGYWLPLPSNRYLLLGKTDVSLHMRNAGVDRERERKGGELSDLERIYMVAQTERAVDYAGPLAGHETGSFNTSDGKRVLVTSQARVLESGKNMNCPFIEKFLSTLLGAEQLHVFCLWLKIARKAQLSGDFRPGQMVAFAGASNCGKSFAQALVTEFLGGRMGKPYRYMIGDTAFNSDVCSAEHWCIEDENASTDIRTRRKFGASLKEATVNQSVSVHGKGRDAVTLPLFRRVTLSVNSEPENLMILPPLDESILDKVILFYCQTATLREDRKENWTLLMKELPNFIRYCESLRVPKAMVCPRFGVRAYHHPALLEALNDVAPETRLLAIIDQTLADDWKKNDGEPWDGTVEELESRLRRSPFAFAVEKLFTFNSACGTYLARLAGKYPERFEARKVKGKKLWRVRP